MFLKIVTASSDRGRGREATVHSVCGSPEPKLELQFSAGPHPHPTALRPGSGRATQERGVLKEAALLALCTPVREWPAQLRDPDDALGKGLACLWGDFPLPV